jgi:hypothetical protein
VSAGVPANIAPGSNGTPAPSDPRVYLQENGRTVVNGVLVSDLIDIQGGYLGGSGTLQGDVIIGAAAMMNPGNSPGTETILGNYHLWGTLTIEIVSPTVHDIVNVAETAYFYKGSQLHFVLDYNGLYSPADGTDIVFLYAKGLWGLENLSYSISGLESDFHYQVYADADADLHVHFYQDGQNSQPQTTGYVNIIYDGRLPGTDVPEPATVALSLLGLALLGWRTRRHGALTARSQ